jgi:hypothetical protein
MKEWGWLCFQNEKRAGPATQFPPDSTILTAFFSGVNRTTNFPCFSCYKASRGLPTFSAAVTGYR